MNVWCGVDIVPDFMQEHDSVLIHRRGERPAFISEPKLPNNPLDLEEPMLMENQVPRGHEIALMAVLLWEIELVDVYSFLAFTQRANPLETPFR